MLSCWTTSRLPTHQGISNRTNKPHALSKTAHRTTCVRSCRRRQWNPSQYAMNQVAKTDLTTKKIHRTPASLQHVKNTHRTRSTNNCSPRSGRKMTAIRSTIKKKKHDHDSTSRAVVGNQATREPQVLGRAKSTTIPHRVCKCASLQRNMTVKHNLSAIHVASVAVETLCQRPQLRIQSQQFLSTQPSHSNITQTRCNSMHRKIAQCSGRLSHTPTARLTDSGVGQHCPEL